MQKTWIIIPVLLVLISAATAADSGKPGASTGTAVSSRPDQVYEELTGWEDYFWNSVRWGILGTLVQTLFYLAASYAFKMTHTELYRSFLLGILFGVLLFFLTIYSSEYIAERAKWNVLVAGLASIVGVWPVFRANVMELIVFTIACACETMLGFCIIHLITG